MEMQVSKVLGVYDICTSLLSNKEENHKESNFINMKAKKKAKKHNQPNTHMEKSKKPFCIKQSR